MSFSTLNFHSFTFEVSDQILNNSSLFLEEFVQSSLILIKSAKISIIISLTVNLYFIDLVTNTQ